MGLQTFRAGAMYRFFWTSLGQSQNLIRKKQLINKCKQNVYLKKSVAVHS